MKKFNLLMMLLAGIFELNAQPVKTKTQPADISVPGRLK